MLRPAGNNRIRDLLRDQICDGYLTEFADRIPHDDAALRAEPIGALLLGLGVMRSVIDTPALADADDVRLLVAKTVAVLADSTMSGDGNIRD